MDRLSERVTTPDYWIPNEEELKILRAMNDFGYFGGTNTTNNVFGRLAIGIATGPDRRYLAIMNFLHSMPK